MRDVNVDRVVSKLGLMVAQRFGVAIQYTSLNDKSSAALETAKRNSGAPMIIAHNQMILPMRVDGVLVGAAQIHDVYSLSGKELAQIKETVDLVLGEVLNMRPSNVIRFFDWFKPEVSAEKGSGIRAFAME